jgi:hypothetical protein
MYELSREVMRVGLDISAFKVEHIGIAGEDEVS